MLNIVYAQEQCLKSYYFDFIINYSSHFFPVLGQSIPDFAMPFEFKVSLIILSDN